MKNILNKWIKGSTLCVASLMAFAACSDDHFDVKSWGGGDKTLWENISAEPSLSDFANILKRTKVMKSENDKSATLYANELLNQSQSFTMWAPVNGSFNAKEWNDTLDKAEALRLEGTSESLRKAQEIEYIVWSHFACNHIARFNHEGKTGMQEVKMLNAKNAKYDGATFNNVPMKGTHIASSNGALHLLNGVSPFAYNIYDYLGAKASLSSINAYIKDPLVDHEEFSEELSVPGAMNEEGKMVYIDSVYLRYNDLLKATGAQIRNEDSTYVAFIPTNAAWDEAIAKLSKIYNYGSSYAWGWNGQEFSKNATNNQALKLSEHMVGDATRTKADSLRDYRVREAIVKNMFFAPYRIKGYETMDSAALISHINKADSLISTNLVTFYNPAAIKGQKNAAQNPSLAGLTPYRASNGYIFNLESYNFDPSYVWVKAENFRPSDYPSRFVARTINSVSDAGYTLYLDENNYNNYRAVLDEAGEVVRDANGDTIFTGVKGEVERNTFQRFVRNARNSNMYVDFRLPQVFSAAYTIKVIMLPSKISYDVVSNPETDTEVVKFSAKIIDDSGKESAEVDIDQDKGQFNPNAVNEIVLWEKFEFAKCYNDLPTGTDSFPLLRLTLKRTARNCEALNVVKVIIEPYRGN